MAVRPLCAPRALCGEKPFLHLRHTFPLPLAVLCVLAPLREIAVALNKSIFSTSYEIPPNPSRQLTIHSRSTCIPNDSRAGRGQYHEGREDHEGNGHYHCNCILTQRRKELRTAGAGGRWGREVGVIGGRPRDGTGLEGQGLTAKGAKTAKGTATATASHAKTPRRKELRNCWGSGEMGPGGWCHRWWSRGTARPGRLGVSPRRARRPRRGRPPQQHLAQRRKDAKNYD